VLGQLDRKCSDAAGARLDEDLLTLAELGLFDQRLPCSMKGGGVNFWQGLCRC